MESIDVNKINLNTDDQESKQFEDIAQQEKVLQEDEEDKIVKTSTAGEHIPENLISDNSELFIKDATWETLGVREDLIKGLVEMGFIKPSKIQATTFPLIMKKPYKHLVAQAHNGSGKTGAFGIGTLSRVDENINAVQAVIFAHTRELVNQTANVLRKMAAATRIKVNPLLNTDKQPDLSHVFVCTPGAFDTFFFKKKLFTMKDLRVLVLDEADHILSSDQFLDVCDKVFTTIVKQKIETQVLFFSATYTDDNFKLIKKSFKSAHMLQVEKGGLTLKKVQQFYYKCDKREDKIGFVEEYLKRSIESERVIIFVNSRDYTEKLTMLLRNKGYKVFLLMGGQMDPTERDLTIKKFNTGEIQILITTNVLARGFDERLVKLIINFDMPVTKVNDKLVVDKENYLHRIGRTGRFGSKGIGLTLISSDNELNMVQELESHYGSNIAEIKSMDELLDSFKKLIAEKF
jgi:ATP-dependent RNA helicase DDX19/DBP5